MCALPDLDGVVDAAFGRAMRLGASHADVRVQRVRTMTQQVRDGRVEGSHESTDTGLGVRVVHDGTWGFAAGVGLTPDDAARLAELACEVARAARPLRGAPVELAAEPVTGPVRWVSPYEIDPFTLDAAERAAPLQAWCERLRDAGVDHADAFLFVWRENKLYADTAGRHITQQRMWLHPMVTAVRVHRTSGAFETMRTLGPPTARGWEYLTGTGWDWAGELDRMPDLLAEKMAAPPVRPGRYDLVIDPTNLWLTIHETVGHATELDRVLGHEAAFAGTSFAGIGDLGSLRYGSPAMTVVADRTTPYALATVGYDDEGVAAQSWHLIRDGVLVGYQVDRQNAGVVGLARSSGCAFADSFARVPLQRMPNVSLVPAPGGPSTEELIAGVRDGVYVVGDRSWSIDMQRQNFQFTGQRFYRIRNGRLAGQLRDVAYQGSTVEFWRALEAVGGPQTYLLSGASRCGKAQPLQISAAGHGCPSALFRGIDVLNTANGVPG